MTFLLPRFANPARCADEEPELFYPDKGGTTLPAKRICNGDDRTPPCRAREECLAWALANERYGIWGGTSALERYWLRRRAG